MNKHIDPAMEFMVRGVRELEIKQEIYKLSKASAWNVDVDDFKVEVNWNDSGDVLFNAPWTTLPTLIGAMSGHVKALAIGSSTREVYAIFLATLLPIYFVKAANISPMLELLKEQMPDFVLQACGPQTDYKASKAAPTNSANSNDSCRGFLPYFNAGIYCLALTYNPEADAILSPNRKSQDAFLSKIGESARTKHNEARQKDEQKVA